MPRRKKTQEPVVSTPEASPVKAPVKVEAEFGDPAVVASHQKRILDMLSSHTIGTFRSAYSGRSKAAALKAFCLYCCGFERSFVTTCRGYDCPLWHYRPYQKDAVSAAKPRRVFTEEQRKAAGERLRKARATRRVLK